MSALQASVKMRLSALGVTGMVDNYRFAAEFVGTGKGCRKRLAEKGLNDFEMDIAIPDLKIGVEVNGGQYSGPRSGHGSVKGLERDARKINQANLTGWRVFVITSSMANNRTDIEQIARYIWARRTTGLMF